MAVELQPNWSTLIIIHYSPKVLLRFQPSFTITRAESYTKGEPLAAHFFFETSVVLGAEFEEVEGLLDEDEMGVILSDESPPFGIVVFPESLPFEGEDVWFLMFGLLVFFLDDILIDVSELCLFR